MKKKKEIFLQVQQNAKNFLSKQFERMKFEKATSYSSFACSTMNTVPMSRRRWQMNLIDNYSDDKYAQQVFVETKINIHQKKEQEKSFYEFIRKKNMFLRKC